MKMPRIILDILRSGEMWRRFGFMEKHLPMVWMWGAEEREESVMTS